MELMIDLETLGTNTDAPVLSIGATLFTKDGIISTFYSKLDVDHQIDIKGRKVTASTLKWWLSQGDSAKEVFSEKPTPTHKALSAFSFWVTQVKKEEYAKKLSVWGNGSTFDVSIMEHILTQYGVKIPWKYSNIMDLRTFKRFVYDGKDLLFKGVRHNALDDAIYQSELVIKGLNK